MKKLLSLAVAPSLCWPRWRSPVEPSRRRIRAPRTRTPPIYVPKDTGSKENFHKPRTAKKAVRKEASQEDDQAPRPPQVRVDLNR